MKILVIINLINLKKVIKSLFNSFYISYNILIIIKKSILIKLSNSITNILYTWLL